LTSPVTVIDNADRAAAALHPLRLQILSALREPDSASGIARRLDLPRQRINYHVRELEKQGLLEEVGEVRKGNCVERMVRATARSFLISPATLGGMAADPETIQDRFSAAYLMALAGRALQDLAFLQPRAEEAGKRLPTMALQAEVRFASAADRNAFAEELGAAVANLIAKYHNDQAPDGRSFRFMVGAYPTPKAPAASGEES
jgi:DNA-binding transcriptional ArsR family regulator